MPTLSNQKDGWQRGFTLVELVLVIVMLGVLAVVAMPNFGSSGAFGGTSFNDQVRAALRYAQKTAVSHHRMVCCTVGASSVTLSIASTFGAGNCSLSLTPLNGTGSFASSSTATVSPTATLYFQPSGAITSDATGQSPTSPVFSISNAGTINVQGNTGYVN